MYISINVFFNSENGISCISFDNFEKNVGFKPIPTSNSCSTLFIIINIAKNISLSLFSLGLSIE